MCNSFCVLIWVKLGKWDLPPHPQPKMSPSLKLVFSTEHSPICLPHFWYLPLIKFRWYLLLDHSIDNRYFDIETVQSMGAHTHTHPHTTSLFSRLDFPGQMFAYITSNNKKIACTFTTITMVNCMLWRSMATAFAKLR